MTTQLKDAVAELLQRHARARVVVKAPALRETVDGLPDGGGELKKDKDYDAISSQLADTLSGGGELTGREARDGAWCLWTTKVALAHDPRTLDPFLRQLRALRHRGASRALALSYLVSFHPDRPGLSAVSGTLRDLADVMGAPFDTLHRQFLLFDEAEGARRVGDRAFSERKAPRLVLEENGLRMEHVLAGGFVEPCARRVLQRAAEDRRLSPSDRLALIETIAVTPGSRRLNFPTHKALVADALLLPFEGRTDVEKSVKDEILNFLIPLEGVGDPRPDQGNWSNMPDARKIAMSWLTEQALRQFLDVVGAVNPNANWKYRRRFWEAMHAAGALKGAWVVLDSAGASEALRRFGKNAGFGRFTSGGVQAGHAVLLMEIGDGVCAEWSFSGQCRFWVDAHRDGAPKLYDKSYDAQFLREGRRYAPVEEIIHSTHTGPNAWQHKAARRISTMTGLRFPQGDYML